MKKKQCRVNGKNHDQKEGYKYKPKESGIENCQR